MSSSRYYLLQTNNLLDSYLMKSSGGKEVFLKFVSNRDTEICKTIRNISWQLDITSNFIYNIIFNRPPWCQLHAARKITMQECQHSRVYRKWRFAVMWGRGVRIFRNVLHDIKFYYILDV